MSDAGQSAAKGAAVLVIDDDLTSRRILAHMLEQEGHRPVLVKDGSAALEMLTHKAFDIVLLDIRMPGMDGFEVCRRIRATGELQALPIVMVTAEGPQEKLAALEAGADDFLVKPFDRGEFLARVRSLLRIKRYHDTIESQRAELASWARTLEQRVEQQVREIERLGRLRRFLSPQVADLLISSGDDESLKAHRRFIAVCFCDLRAYTAFLEGSEPEEVMAVLGEFYDKVGGAIARFQATVGDLAGDGVMAYFNDPLACHDPEMRAAEMAIAIQEGMRELIARWRKVGHDLDIGIGIASGYATLGMTGFEGRFEYKPFGAVVNVAARLCQKAAPGQILVSQRVCAAIEEEFRVEMLGEMSLKGFQRPVPILNLVGRQPTDAVKPQT